METTNTTHNRRASVQALKPIAYRASQGISFTPEERGEQHLDDCERALRAYLAQIPEEMHATFEAKYVQLYGQWLGAMSRCISPMITGASKFPTRRADKLSGYERNAYERMQLWADKFVKRCNRQQRLTGWAEIERLQEKVETLQRLQDTMKAANKVCRSTKLSEVEKVDELVALGIKEQDAVMLLHPTQSWQRAGFESYQLTNNLAKIKDTQARIARLTKMATSEDRELEVNGVKVLVCNSEDAYACAMTASPTAKPLHALKATASSGHPLIRLGSDSSPVMPTMPPAACLRLTSSAPNT